MERIKIVTFGCSVNLHESEIMAGLLTKANFSIVNTKDEADVIIINICTVKGTANALREIRKTREEFPYKKIIVAGCISEDIIPSIREICSEISLVSTHNIKEIVQIVEETLNNNTVEALTKNREAKINLPKVRVNPVIAIVPISSSCAGRCSYCSVKPIKGDLVSYPQETIIEEIIQALQEGCKEIWITAQDSAAYMLEKKHLSQLPELLQKIVSIKGQFKLRVGMMNPNNIIPILNELIESYSSEKIFKFLHVPVQSGNDEVLEKMQRGYTVDDFRRIIREFRKKFPRITVSTDIICGFPTETKNQFMDSVKLIKEIKPAVLNISRFVARPGTKAAEMEQLSGSEIKDRSRMLTSIFDWVSFEQNKMWVGWSGNVIIDEKGKNGTFIARNFAYKPVVMVGNFKLGDEVKVVINSITRYDLRAEVQKV